MRVEGFNYVGTGLSTNKNDSTVNSDMDFCQYLLNIGKIKDTQFPQIKEIQDDKKSVWSISKTDENPILLLNWFKEWCAKTKRNPEYIYSKIKGRRRVIVEEKFLFTIFLCNECEVNMIKFKYKLKPAQEFLFHLGKSTWF